MKKYIKCKTGLFLALTCLLLTVFSCKYQEIGNTTWPDQLIYMPAAVYNTYTIDQVMKATGVDPTLGFPYRFQVDTVAGKFVIPLGVYRSGPYNEGTFRVDIAANTDTITKLLAIAGKLPAGTLLLSSEKYSLPSSVEIKDGQEVVRFDMLVNLDTLRNRFPSGKFAIGVSISSTSRKTNPKLATTLILIDTKIMKPTAAFSTSLPNASDPKTLKFNLPATSQVYYAPCFGTKFIWDFGDGSPVQVVTNDKNTDVIHTYAAAGTYTAKLTVQGISYWADKSVATLVLVIP